MFWTFKNIKLLIAKLIKKCNIDLFGDIQYYLYFLKNGASAGLERGQIKNVKKLAFNPNQGQRDILYKNGINPIAAFPGQGTVMWGQKTLLDKPSSSNI